MKPEKKLGLLIFFYLTAGFLFYILTNENKLCFFLYRLSFGILLLPVLYLAYRILAKKYS